MHTSKLFHSVVILGVSLAAQAACSDSSTPPTQASDAGGSTSSGGSSSGGNTSSSGNASSSGSNADGGLVADASNDAFAGWVCCG